MWAVDTGVRVYLDIFLMLLARTGEILRAHKLNTLMV